MNLNSEQIVGLIFCILGLILFKFAFEKRKEMYSISLTDYKVLKENKEKFIRIQNIFAYIFSAFILVQGILGVLYGFYKYLCIVYIIYFPIYIIVQKKNLIKKDKV